MDQQSQSDFASFGAQGYVNPGGDVVFTSTGIPEKKSKKKFVIIGVVAVLLVVGAVLSFVLGGGEGGGLFGGGIPAGFTELKNFIEKGDAETQALFEDAEGDDESEDEEDEEGDDDDGDEDEESSNGEDYIMAIRISRQGETEVKKYYTKLAKLEQEFYNKSATKLDGAVLSKYSNALKVLKNAINYYSAKDGLIKAYEKNGDSGADKYFDENIDCDDSSEDDLAEVCTLEEDYYTAVLTEHKTYSDVGCYGSNGYDSGCVRKNYGLNDSVAKMHENGNWRDYYSLIQSYDSLDIIQNNIFGIEKIISGDKQ